MARRVRSVTSASGTALKFEKTIVMCSEFKRTDQEFRKMDRQISSHPLMRKIFTNTIGIIGVGSCGDENFVCTFDEIPELIAYLQEAYAANLKTQSNVPGE